MGEITVIYCPIGAKEGVFVDYKKWMYWASDYWIFVDGLVFNGSSYITKFGA